MIRTASLGMYDFPWLREATDALWAGLRDRLRAGGVAGVPDALDRTRSLRAIWRDPGLLLAQICGYPLLTEFSGALQIVATPVYDLPGCTGARHRSLVVAREADPAASLAAMRGRRCAVNGRDSNTGMNLLRALIAPLAAGRPFFRQVVETGAHLDSLCAVRDGLADLAAIDCVTYGLVARHRPDLLRGIRVMAETAATPGLPFVTSLDTRPADLAALRRALAGAAGGSPGWVGVERLDLAAYAPLLVREGEAAAAGYGTLA